jgi:organic hydroperoxide reductase OsmC/OhrA
MTNDDSQRRMERLHEAITDLSDEQLDAINAKLRFWSLSETAHVFRVEESETFCGRQIDMRTGEIVTPRSDDESGSVSPQIEQLCEACFNGVLHIYDQQGQTEMNTDAQQEPITTTEVTKTVTTHPDGEDYRATVEISITGTDNIALEKAREIAATVHDMLDD